MSATDKEFPRPSVDTPILVAGAGGFIGGWLVADLLEQGFSDVRAVDVKPLHEWHQVHANAHNRILDLSLRDVCFEAVADRQHVYQLACDMGGIGFIESNKAACMLSSLITTHLLVAARDLGSEKFFFASSACVYNAEKQAATDIEALREGDAYPAMPEDGYGWEKLFAERMVKNFSEDFGIEGRVARYHNIYGPHGTWEGGREKAPAAICRKVAQAVLTGRRELEIWGDGEQTRSFTYISDAVFGTERLMWSDVNEPLNIGSNQMVSINQLLSIVEAVAGVTLVRRYNLDTPTGVRGRNSDNSRIEHLLDWSPSTSLEQGMEETYRWVYDQVSSTRDR